MGPRASGTRALGAEQPFTSALFGPSAVTPPPIFTVGPFLRALQGPRGLYLLTISTASSLANVRKPSGTYPRLFLLGPSIISHKQNARVGLGSSIIVARCPRNRVRSPLPKILGQLFVLHSYLPTTSSFTPKLYLFPFGERISRF